MFDGMYHGYIAIGDTIYFRSFAEGDVQVLQCPQDVDSHALSAALNDSARAVTGIAYSMSQFKF